LTSPLLLAQQAATFDHFSKGRLIINVINGANTQAPPYGLFEDHDDRYALADEYWGEWRRILQGETVTFDGRFVKVRDAQLSIASLQTLYPELNFGGSSPAAMAVAAKHVDTFTRICGPGSAWRSAGHLPSRSSAMPRRLPSGRNMKRSGSTSSSCRLSR
jgi:alkanesulfonate monooxygenase